MSNGFTKTLILACLLLAACNPEGWTGGTVSINGTAASDDLENFSLEWGAGWFPESWSSQGMNPTSDGLLEVTNSTIAQFNSSAAGDQNVTVRLTVRDTQGRQSEDFVYLQLAQHKIIYPPNRAVLESNQTIGIIARNAVDGFLMYTLEACIGGNCTLLKTDSIPVDNQVVANYTIPQIFGTVQLLLTTNTSETTQRSDSNITVFGQDIYEPDNNYTSATWIAIGEVQTHNHVMENDSDWVKFNATQGTMYDIMTYDTTGSDTVLYLYNTDAQTLIVYGDVWDYWDYYDAQVRWYCPANGTYYINFKEWYDSDGGTYSIVINASNKTRDAYEPNNNLTAATLIPAYSQPIYPNLVESNDSDYFYFNATAGDAYQFRITNTSGFDAKVCLYRSSGTLIHCVDRAYWQSSETLTYIPQYDETLYLQIYADYSWPALSGDGYTLYALHKQDVEPDDYEDDDYYLYASRVVANGTAYLHTFGKSYDYDYFSINTTANHTYKIRSYNLDKSWGCDTSLYELVDLWDRTYISNSKCQSEPHCEQNATLHNFTASQSGLIYFMFIDSLFYYHNQGCSYSIYVTDTTVNDCINIIANMSISHNEKLCPYTYNFSDALTITSNNTVLDCGGATLQNNGTAGNGIVVTGSNVTVKGCTIKGFGSAILASAAQNTFYNNTFLNNTCSICANTSNNLAYFNTFYQDNSQLGTNATLCYQGLGNTYVGFSGKGCVPTITGSSTTITITPGNDAQATSAFYDPENSSLLKIVWVYDGTNITNKTLNTTSSGSESGTGYSHTYGFASSNITISSPSTGTHQLTLLVNDSYESATRTWTINVEEAVQRSGGGGGGGGGSGASSIESFKRQEKDLKANQTKRLDINVGTLPLKTFSLTPKNDIEGVVTFEIQNKGKSASGFKNLEKKIYYYIEVTHINLDNLDVQSSEFDFYVPKEWLDLKGLDREQIALYRLEDDWRMLETRVYSEDDKYIYYTAKSPGLSIFAIGEGSTKKPVQAAPVSSEIEIEQVNEPEEPELAVVDQPKEPLPENPANTNMVPFAIMIITLALLIGLGMSLITHYGPGDKRSAFEKLEDFIKRGLRTGKHRDEIKKTLLSKGWPEHLVHHHLSKIEEELKGEFDKIDNIITEALKAGQAPLRIEEILKKHGVHEEVIKQKINNALGFSKS